MAADTYNVSSFNEPALVSRGSIIVRSKRVDLADLVGDAGGVITADALEANDVLKFFKLPPDVKILWGRVDAEELDGGTSLTWDLQVTNGTTTKLIFDGSTIGQSAGYIDSRDAGGTGQLGKFGTDGAIGYVVPDDNYYVALKVIDAPTGAGAGDELEVEIAYTSQLESGDAAFRT